VNVGVTVGTGMAVNRAVDEIVNEVSDVCVVVCELVGETDDDRVILDDILELAVSVGVFVNLIEPETVAV
jgi:hypothetical protein